MLVATLGVQFFSGILYVWSLFKVHLVAHYQWSDAEATLPYTISTLVFASSMFVAGLLLDRAGPRVMISIGTSLMGLGLLLSGFANTVWLWALTFGLITSAGVGFNYLVATPAAIQWFPTEKRGRITGLVVAGVALSPIMYSPLVNVSLDTYGLRYGLFIIGAVALVIPLFLAQRIKSPPEGYIPTSGETESSTNEENDLNWQEMIRTPDFYKLFLMLAFSSASGLIIFGHMTRIAQLQADWDGGYLLLMLIAVFSGLGRFLGGAVSDLISKGNLLRIVFLLQAINMLLFNTFTSIPTLSLGVAIGGLCYGAVLSVFPVITADYYGVKHLGANYGLTFIAWGIGGILGPQIAGSVFDATGSYKNAYYLAFAMLMVATATSFFLKKEKRIN